MRKRRLAAASSLGVGDKWKKPPGKAPRRLFVLSNGELASSYMPFANPNSIKSAISESQLRSARVSDPAATADRRSPERLWDRL